MDEIEKPFQPWTNCKNCGHALKIVRDPEEWSELAFCPGCKQVAWAADGIPPKVIQ